MLHGPADARAAALDALSFLDEIEGPLEREEGENLSALSGGYGYDEQDNPRPHESGIQNRIKFLLNRDDFKYVLDCVFDDGSFRLRRGPGYLIPDGDMLPATSLDAEPRVFGLFCDASEGLPGTAETLLAEVLDRGKIFGREPAWPDNGLSDAATLCLAVGALAKHRDELFEADGMALSRLPDTFPAFCLGLLALDVLPETETDLVRRAVSLHEYAVLGGFAPRRVRPPVRRVTL